MSQEKELDQWKPTDSIISMKWYMKKQTSITNHNQGSRFKRIRHTVLTDLINSIEPNSTDKIHESSQSAPKVAKQFKTKLPNPKPVKYKIKSKSITNSKNWKPQDLNLNQCSSLPLPVASGVARLSATLSTSQSCLQEFEMKDDHVSCLFKRISKASSRSQSNHHKLKSVLFYIVDYESCFLCLSPPSSLLLFPFFALFAYTYMDPTNMFCQMFFHVGF